MYQKSYGKSIAYRACHVVVEEELRSLRRSGDVPKNPQELVDRMNQNYPDLDEQLRQMIWVCAGHNIQLGECASRWITPHNVNIWIEEEAWRLFNDLGA